MKNRVPLFLAVSLILVGARPVWSEEGDQQKPDAAARDIASQVPDTDIFLLTIGADGEPEKASLRNLTHRVGYDNQPAFLPGGQALLFSAIGEDLQSDVYSLELTGGNLRQLTHTSESEYSPTPLADGGFSVVRVETDGAQQLWRYGEDRRPVERLLQQFNNKTGVGGIAAPGLAGVSDASCRCAADATRRWRGPALRGHGALSRRVP